MFTLMISGWYFGCVAYFLLCSADSQAACSFRSAKAMPCTPASVNAEAASLSMPAAAYTYFGENLWPVAVQGIISSYALL